MQHANGNMYIDADGHVQGFTIISFQPKTADACKNEWFYNFLKNLSLQLAESK